ncbi:unnamed protein product [Adineta steineri]|uniref:Uncharacterized protein n=1 Tax=Adineta steineri TaxID=433720 RepID=A0A814JLW8_9BILA|nr:unnamed protein product [Adineta steineri]CAF3649999.1 unnamed protein product [Adineta steineri]
MFQIYNRPPYVPQRSLRIRSTNIRYPRTRLSYRQTMMGPLITYPTPPVKRNWFLACLHTCFAILTIGSNSQTGKKQQNNSSSRSSRVTTVRRNNTSGGSGSGGSCGGVGMGGLGGLGGLGGM